MNIDYNYMRFSSISEDSRYTLLAPGHTERSGCKLLVIAGGSLYLDILMGGRGRE